MYSHTYIYVLGNMENKLKFFKIEVRDIQEIQEIRGTPSVQDANVRIIVGPWILELVNLLKFRVCFLPSDFTS
jgi:hypothetical protein